MEQQTPPYADIAVVVEVGVEIIDQSRPLRAGQHGSVKRGLQVRRRLQEQKRSCDSFSAAAASMNPMHRSHSW
jgi:hypothetical protein